MIELWEILVPCKFEDTQKPVRTRHHKNFDNFVLKITTGMTILKPSKGLWKNSGSLYEDRMIPVRIACTEKQIKEIGSFARKHYRQVAIFIYKISDTVLIVEE